MGVGRVIHMEARKKSTATLRTERRRTKNPTTDLSIAHLWPKTGTNIGTLVRTCDAVNARLVVPITSRRDVRRGNTIGEPNAPVDYPHDEPIDWLRSMTHDHRIIGVELAEHAIPLVDLEPASGPTIALLGHESLGIPDDALFLCDEVVEIPMVGVGNSLNVAVAGSLVAYKLRGFV